MRVLLRADGGPGIGVGHVMRCLALAQECRQRGHEVALCGAVEGNLLGQAVAEASRTGVELAPLESAPGRLAALPSPQHLAGVDVVHVDHYGLGPELRHRLRALADPAVLSVMHDGADGADGAAGADLAIDPTVGSERAARPAGVPWSLRGARWVPLRAAVQAGPGGAPRVGPRGGGEAPFDIVVVMGGADPLQCAPPALRAVVAAVRTASTRMPLPARVQVIATDDTRAELEAVAAGARGEGLEVEVSAPIPDLTGRLRAADLVVSAAGTTVWELCALGTPMALVCVVENQRAGYDEVVGQGAAVGLGAPDDLGTATTASALTDLLTSPSLRSRLAGVAGRLVDGQGAWRIVAAWEQLVAGSSRTPSVRQTPVLRVRPAATTDASLLHAWRNDPVTRNSSRSSEPVPWSAHERWFASSLVRPDRILMVAEDSDGAVGTARWDEQTAGEWEVSITVAPQRRGHGLAGAVLQAAEAHLSSRCSPSSLTAYLAVVHSQNGASRRLFEAAGYLPEQRPDGFGFARSIKLAR